MFLLLLHLETVIAAWDLELKVGKVVAGLPGLTAYSVKLSVQIMETCGCVERLCIWSLPMEHHVMVQPIKLSTMWTLPDKRLLEPFSPCIMVWRILGYRIRTLRIRALSGLGVICCLLQQVLAILGGKLGWDSTYAKDGFVGSLRP